MTKAIVNEQHSLEIQSSGKTISAWGSQGGNRQGESTPGRLKKCVHGLESGNNMVCFETGRGSYREVLENDI